MAHLPAAEIPLPEEIEATAPTVPPVHPLLQGAPPGLGPDELLDFLLAQRALAQHQAQPPDQQQEALQPQQQALENISASPPRQLLYPQPALQQPSETLLTPPQAETQGMLQALLQMLPGGSPPGYSTDLLYGTRQPQWPMAPQMLQPPSQQWPVAQPMLQTPQWPQSYAPQGFGPQWGPSAAGIAQLNPQLMRDAQMATPMTSAYATPMASSPPCVSISFRCEL
jgi:hypothetical protein